MFTLIIRLLTLCLPSCLKIFFLRLLGYSIEKNCYFGFSLILSWELIIEDYVYIGSSVRVLPGVEIPSYCFVGMGSVISKSFKDNYILIAGAPAKVMKNLSSDSIFFNRLYHRQPHHPASYRG